MQEFEPTPSGDKDFSAKAETPKLNQAKSPTHGSLNLNLPRQSEKDLIKVKIKKIKKRPIKVKKS